MLSRVEEFHKQSSRVGEETLLLNKIQASLQKPLAERCEDVRRMINEFPVKDLHILYPQLLASVFGLIPSKGWLLHSANSRDIEVLRHFLGPRGHLWRLVGKLERDSFLQYEFPVSCLPKQTQLLLVEGVIPALYCNKIQFIGGNQIKLNLGAQEYFLFQFAYFITQSSSQLEGRNSETSNETLYTALFSDYLEHFLPTNAPLIFPGVYQTNAARSNTGGEPHLHSSTPFSGLIKSFENKPSSSYDHLFHHSSPQVLQQSETFLQILVEVWLNHTVDKEGTNTFSPFGQNYFLPSIDHVRIVRMLVKHLHLFMNMNIHIDNVAMVRSSKINEDFYRTFMPATLKVMKKQLHWFIRHCFTHWPLDPTFKFILETWLSYIQPWRYVSPSPSSSQRIVSLNWKPFIDHNVLFYTVLLQEFLNRAEKLNLRSLKDAQMFYRVTKVLSQQNLMAMVKEVENELISYQSSVQQGHGKRLSRSPKSAQYSHFMELQFSGTSYRPLFTKETISNICYLVRHIEDILQSLRDPETREYHGQGTCGANDGWLKRTIKSTVNWLQDVFSIDEHYCLIQDENRQVQEHLQQVSNQLKTLFQIQDNEHDRTFPWAAVTGDTSISHDTPRASSVETQPDCVQTEQGMVLTGLGKYQMANGLRRFDIQYSGDPDLQPVRSYEVVFLVRTLYKLSTMFNEKFAPKLSRIYRSPNWPGCLARHLSPAVQKPHTLSPVKQNHSKTTSSSSPQPKISLRYLASYRLWTQLFLLYFVLLFVFDRPWSTVVLIMFILSVMFLRNIHAVRTRDHDRQSVTDELYEG